VKAILDGPNPPHVDTVRGGQQSTAVTGGRAVAGVPYPPKTDATTDSLRFTALIEAAYQGRTGVVEALIERGANVDARAKDGRTALAWAVYEGRGDVSRVVELLVEGGADLEARDRNGATPLMLAAYSGTRRAVEALLSAGADVTARDNGGGTVMDCVEGTWSENQEIKGLLREVGEEEWCTLVEGDCKKDAKKG
jgi:hypothetical protein